jgi:SAM-dependent methyltransferase
MHETTGQRFWDEKYSGSERLWSGAPNGVLVAEVTGMPPGQALDVGCGEGADALWLAGRGWQVTAVDISRIALQRAALGSAGETGVAWVRADLTTTRLPAAGFDLVSAQYFPLPRQQDDAALRNLLATVAPGGTLLLVGHDHTGLEPQHGPDVDPSAYYEPSEVAALLDSTWLIEVNQSRPRTRPAPPGTQFTHDTVLRASRRPAG